MMEKLNYMKLAISLMFLVLLAGCFESDYTHLVKSELNKNIRYDSILFGISLGDTKRDFFEKCMELNRRQLVVQGPLNSSVQHTFTDTVYHDQPTQIKLLFYPRCDEKDIINHMDMEFSYVGWAPWNTKLQSDVLEKKVLLMLQDWYGGNEFIEVEIDGKTVPVKVDGNRRIIVQRKDTMTVVVKIQDIMHPDYQHSISKS